MSTQLPRSGPLRVSFLSALSAVISPNYNINPSNLNWNDFTRVPYYITSTISQAYQNFYANSSIGNFYAGNFLTPNGAISLTNYSNTYRLSVTSHVMANMNLNVTVNSIINDDGFIISTNRNGNTTSSGVLSGVAFLWIYDPQQGLQSNYGVSSSFNLSSINAQEGDYIDFYVAEGPRILSPTTPYYYAQANISFSFTPIISVIAPPLHFSYYQNQDYDIPSYPLALSNFHSAANYDLVTNNLFSISANKFNNYYPTSAYYIYTANGSTLAYSHLVTQLSANQNVYIISTKYSPITGILTTSNSKLVITNNTQSFDLLLDVNSASYNNYPLTNLISVSAGTTTLNLSSYMYSLSSYASLYIHPSNLASNLQFNLQILNYPILTFPNNLLL